MATAELSFVDEIHELGISPFVKIKSEPKIRRREEMSRLANLVKDMQDPALENKASQLQKNRDAWAKYKLETNPVLNYLVQQERIHGELESKTRSELIQILGTDPGQISQHAICELIIRKQIGDPPPDFLD